MDLNCTMIVREGVALLTLAVYHCTFIRDTADTAQVDSQPCRGQFEVHILCISTSCLVMRTVDL